MPEIFTVEQRGIGKPDYSKEISLGRTRPGLTLHYNETLKNFGRSFTNIASPYPFITIPLAPGASAHLIDSETYLEMPFNVPVGYTLAMISASYSFTQDAIIWAYLEGYLIANFGCPVGGLVFYEAQVIGHGTALFDPTGDDPHLFDIIVTNQGSANLEGGGSTFGLFKAVGTKPLPTTKTVRCKFCGHEETVPRETTKWICPNCSQLNIYYDLSRFRGT